MPVKEMWSVPSGPSGVGVNNGRQVMANSNSYGYMSSGMQLHGGHPAVAPPHDRSQEICKYFINGGCLRGTACPYLHELPDERHLDVNGLGFILNPNVHNAQKTVTSPQPNVGGSTAVGGQVSPTSSGSPLVMGLGGQPGVGRPFPFGPSSRNGNGDGKPSAGGKPHFGTLPAATSSAPPFFLMAPPTYRPPEPYLEHNLPPALALPLKSSPKDVAATLSMSLLQP